MVGAINFLDGGQAEYMGSGVFVLCQEDAVANDMQRVVITADDMRAMLATLAD